eukprot:93687-Rhodomonas_salina.1
MAFGATVTVLTKRMRSGCRAMCGTGIGIGSSICYAMCGTDIAYGIPLQSTEAVPKQRRCAYGPGISLRAPYAQSARHIAHPRCPHTLKKNNVCSPLCHTRSAHTALYAMTGTDLRYAAIRLHTGRCLSSVRSAYPILSACRHAMRCPLLS